MDEIGSGFSRPVALASAKDLLLAENPLAARLLTHPSEPAVPETATFPASSQVPFINRATLREETSVIAPLPGCTKESFNSADEPGVVVISQYSTDEIWWIPVPVPPPNDAGSARKYSTVKFPVAFFN